MSVDSCQLSVVSKGLCGRQKSLEQNQNPRCDGYLSNCSAARWGDGGTAIGVGVAIGIGIEHVSAVGSIPASIVSAALGCAMECRPGTGRRLIARPLRLPHRSGSSRSHAPASLPLTCSGRHLLWLPRSSVGARRDAPASRATRAGDTTSHAAGVEGEGASPKRDPASLRPDSPSVPPWAATATESCTPAPRPRLARALCSTESHPFPSYSVEASGCLTPRRQGAKGKRGAKRGYSPGRHANASCNTASSRRRLLVWVVVSWASSWSQTVISSSTLATMRCCSGSGGRGTSND